MIDKLLNILYKVIKLYKPHIDRWVVKAFMGTGFSLIISGLTGLSWYISLLLNIIKEETLKKFGTDYGIGIIEWTTFWIGVCLVIIGLAIYIINKRFERHQFNTPNLLIAIIHKSIDDFMTPDFKQINNGKYENFQINIIEINQTKTYKNGNLEYPDYSVFEQDDILTRIKTLKDSNPNSEIAYFGLAHIPLLFLFGTQIADKFKIDFYEYNRRTFQWDFLDTNDSLLNISNESTISDQKNSNAIILIEISYPIRNELVEEIIQENQACFKIKTDKIGIDSISTFTDITNISLVFRSTIDTIIDQYSNVDTIHIFYAGPPSLAVNLARKISKRTDPRFIIYNYMRSQTPNYKWGIILNSNNDIHNLVIKN